MNGRIAIEVKLGHMWFDDSVCEAVVDVIRGGKYIKGPNLEGFERDFAEFCGAKYAVGVSSGTSAILLSLMAMGIGHGDEVIVPSHTFIATASPAKLLGATPIFADVCSDTYTIDPVDVRKKISGRTKAIIPVHLYGHPCDMDEILAIARDHDLKVIEDACQAHGAAYKGRRTGTLGHVGCFSFFPSKNMTVLGDGGMVTTDDSDLAGEISMLRDHGRKEKYVHQMLGFNCRLSEIHAAIGRAQLAHLESWNQRRREIAARYSALLSKQLTCRPVEKSWAHHVYHLYVIRSRRRDELMAALARQGIETGIHYPVPLHRQPCLMSAASLPVTEGLVNEVVSLPMHPHMSDDEVDYVASKVNAFVEMVA